MRDIFQVEMRSRSMVFKEPAKSSSSSVEETFHRMITVRNNRTKFVNVFIFT